MPVTNLKSIAVKAESTFGTFPTDQSTYARVPAEEITWTPEEEHLARPVQSTTLGSKQTGVIGRKGGTLTFKIGLHGLSAAATGAPSEYGWAADLLKACGLTRSAGTGTTISGTSSTTTSVDVGDASGLAIGQYVVINGEARLVTAVDTAATPDNITVAPALSAAPTTAGVAVYGSVAYWLTGSTPSESASFVVNGDSHAYIFSGCNGVASLDSVSAGQRPMLTLTFSVDRWTRDTSTLTGAFPSLTAPNGIVARASPFYWGASARAVSDVGFATGQTIVEQASTAGEHGRASWRYTDAEPVLTASAHRSTSTSDALQTDYETPTSRTFLLQLGSSAGRMFAVAAEVAQLTSYPAEGDGNGLVTLPLTASVKAPTTSGLPVFSLGFC